LRSLIFPDLQKFSLNSETLYPDLFRLSKMRVRIFKDFFQLRIFIRF